MINMKLIEDLKKLKYGAYALLLIAIELSLYYLMNPELTFTIDEKLNEYGDDLLPVMILFTPISALIEELGLRAFPHVICIGLIKGWPSFTDLKKRIRSPNEGKHYFVFMIPLFGAANGIVHLTNVASASSINILKYFFIHFVGGSYLGTIFLRYGFWQVYITHLLCDMFLLTYSMIFQG